MEFKDIQKANESINTTPIKGKDYAEVNQRIKVFRMLYPSGKIDTQLLKFENGICIVQAKVYDSESNLLGSGLAYEKENSTFINKTSFLENCETSAVGRALGMLGIGIDTSVASYEEVANAIEQQETFKPDIKSIEAQFEALGIEDQKEKVLEAFKISSFEELTEKQEKQLYASFKKKQGQLEEEKEKQ